MTTEINGVRFTDSDIVNPEEFGATGGYPNLFLFHNHGVTVGLAFAENAQDAIDELADAGKLDSFKLTDEELASGDYGSEPELTCSFLGNDCLPYDIDGLAIVSVPVPPVSFVACYNASNP